MDLDYKTEVPKARPHLKNSKAQRRFEFFSRMEKILGSSEESENLQLTLEQFAASPVRALRINSLRKQSYKKILAEVEAGQFADPTRPIPWQSGAFFFNSVERDAKKKAKTLFDVYTGAGAIFVQEPGAMEVVNALNPSPGEWVLDLCAAPGAKATQIVERLGGQGWLVANEPVRGRAEKLDSLLARHGALNVSIFSLDPTTLSSRFPKCFHKILVDAPCSGESLFAKRTEKRSDIRDADVKGCARRQFVILSRASEMLRPGGLLVYSTCTYSREENEDIVASFLRDNVGWELVREQRRWPHKDGVAGGYFAILRAPGEVRAGPLSKVDWSSPAGLMRHGPLRWNKEWDLYALAMANDASQEIPWPQKSLSEDFKPSEPSPFWAKGEVEIEVALAFLHGQSLENSKVQRVFLPQAQGEEELLWRISCGDLPLGPAREAPGRFNNLLPKRLRLL